MVLVGIKLGAKSVASNGANTGQREAVGAIFGLLIAGVLIGAALIIVPMLHRCRIEQRNHTHRSARGDRAVADTDPRTCPLAPH